MPITLPVKSMASIENEYLAVFVLENGAIKFIDKQNKVNWGSAKPGWVALSGDGITEIISLESSSVATHTEHSILHLSYQGISGDYIQDQSFKMLVRITVSDYFFDIDIVELTTSHTFISVEYPAHILTVKTGVEEGAVVIPSLDGILIPSRYDAGFMRFGQNIWDTIADIEERWAFESGMLNMPWFGAMLESSSVLAYVISPADCELRLIGNAVVGENGRTASSRRGEKPGVRLSSVTPIWLASQHKLSYTRQIRFEFVTHGYVGMAKRYRHYAKQSGRLVTMREKMTKTPEYAKIIGAPDIKVYVYTHRLDNPHLRAWSGPVLTGYTKVHTTFEQVACIADELYALGVEKCMILLGGWNRAGYDREHVDMWPPAEDAGGIEGLQAACERVKAHGYIFALHDNYNDFYPDAPSYDQKYILKESSGTLRLGGVWDGGLCYVVCSSQQRELLNRNLNLVLASVPLNGYYFDVVTAVSPYECYDERHPNTRSMDLANRQELFAAIRDNGLVAGGERGTDWAMPIAAFYEGLQGGGTGYHRGVAYRTGLSIPLFYLVYHDCVVGYWQHGTPFGREDHANHVLHDTLCAQPSSWSLVYDQWHDLKFMIKQTYDLLGKLHERTAHEAMVNHEILTKDYMVQKATYGDGTEVWVNYGIISFQIEGMQLPPKGFMLKVPGEPIKIATVNRKIEYINP